MLKKYKIQVKVTETGIYFWSGQQITRVNTKEKAEEVSREIKELLKTPEEKKKIEKWNSQLIESWENIQKK